MLTEKEVFQNAFALVSNRETFGQGPEQCGRINPDRYCTSTAIGKFVKNGERLEDTLLWSSIVKAAKLPDASVFTVWQWNDTHTHDEVVALWRSVGEVNGWL